MLERLVRLDRGLGPQTTLTPAANKKSRARDTCPVTPEEYLQETGERLRADDSAVSVVSLGGRHALVGHRIKPSLGLLTPLDLFTIAVPVPAATLDVVTDAIAQAVDYAKQTALEALGYTSQVVRNPVAVIPVVVAAEVAPDARAEVEASPDKHLSVITLPAIVDLQDGQTHWYTGRLLYGALYASWLRERLRVAVPPPAHATPQAWDGPPSDPPT